MKYLKQNGIKTETSTCTIWFKLDYLLSVLLGQLVLLH